MTVLERIRLVEEPTFTGEQSGCTLCTSAAGPFVEAMLPASLLGRGPIDGAVYVCANCAEGFCSALGVVSTDRWEATVARAQEAETAAGDGERAAKTWAGKALRLEQQVAEAEARATIAEDAAARATRELEALRAETDASPRQELLARIQAIAENELENVRTERSEDLKAVVAAEHEAEESHIEEIVAAADTEKPAAPSRKPDEDDGWWQAHAAALAKKEDA